MMNIKKAASAITRTSGYMGHLAAGNESPPQPSTAERKLLTLEEFEAALAPGDEVHTLRQRAGGPPVGADWVRSDILAAAEEHGAELAGPQAFTLGHGLLVGRNSGKPFFAAHRRDFEG